MKKNMQENLLDEFIQEYTNAKNKILQESSPLHLLINRVQHTLNHITSLNSHTLHLLNTLNQNIYEPMKIAIIGQFSSGKSTFLNAILGQNILPSGITPITTKVCHIAYGAEYMLEISYKNGNSAIKPLEYINQVGKAENAKIAFYKLYAPLELLKSINFLDTPGFNSLNQNDTDTTNNVLENVDGIIWLTLIDNVGKQSEKNIILSHIKRYASKSLCVLNQKDRLKNQEEIQSSLNHAKKTFKAFFEDIIAISARDALNSYKLPKYEAEKLRVDSNIQAVIDFLQTHISPIAVKAKKHTICTQLRSLVLTHSRLNIHAYIKLAKLQENLNDYVLQSAQTFQESNFYVSFDTLFISLETQLESITQYIYNNLEKSPKTFMRIERKFGIKIQKEQIKEITTLPRERLISALCNADSIFLRNFIKLSFEIKAKAEELNSLFDSHIENLRNTFMQWEQTFVAISQTPPLKEILNAYEKLASIHYENINAQLMLIAKILTLNYTPALHLCLNSISLKIGEALEKYSKSPEKLPLFNPTLENIRDELNMGFGFAFLQEQLLAQPLHKKTLSHFQHEQKALYQKHYALLETYKQEHISHHKELKNILSALKAMLREQVS